MSTFFLKNQCVVNFIQNSKIINLMDVESELMKDVREQLITENKIVEIGSIYRIKINGRQMIVKVFEETVFVEEDMFQDRALDKFRFLSHLDSKYKNLVAEMNERKCGVIYTNRITIKLPAYYLPTMKPQRIESNESNKLRYRGKIEDCDLVTDNIPLVEFINCYYAHQLECPHFIEPYFFTLNSLTTQMMFMEELDTNLEDLINDDGINSNEMISILFQITFSLGMLWEKLQMTHNDLHLTNIFVKFEETYNSKKLLYEVGDKKFYIDGTSYVVKISDFGFSSKWSRPKILRTDVVRNELDPYIPNFPIPCYDILYLCDYIYNNTTFDSCVDEIVLSIIDFFKHNEGIKFNMYDKDSRLEPCRELANSKTTPKDILLESGIFDDFLVAPTSDIQIIKVAKF